MFGGNFASAEPGIAFFSDDRPAGSVHFVEFETPAAFPLNAYRLVLADDTGSGERGVSTVRLYAFDSASNSFQLIDTYTPATHPYGILQVTRNVTAVTARKFRAEFVQWGSSRSAGPRVFELDVVSLNQNLLVNGGAEDDQSAAGDGTADHDVLGWINETGQFTVTKYTTGGGFPTGASPGPNPRNRGNFFFSGAQAATSSASQTIDVSWCASRIDAGSQGFSLSGFLGGLQNQLDEAQLTVTFRDAANASLGTASIGPVTAADRNSVTGMLYRFTGGTVPAGTRSVEAVLVLSRVSNGNYNDGYADDLAFRLVGDEFNGRDEFALTQGGTSGVWNYGYTAGPAATAVTLYPNAAVDGSRGSTERWNDNSIDVVPAIFRNPSTSSVGYTGVIQPPELLNLHPGPNGQRSVVRWTAPRAGTFLVHGLFQGISTIGTTTDAKILRNETETLFDEVVNGYRVQKPFSFTVTVSAGDGIDFSVGWGTNDSASSDSTGLVVTIGQPVTGCEDAPANQQVFVPADNSPSDVLSGNSGSLAGGATYAAGVVGRAWS